ncbi:UDP-glucuronosyltransferase 3A2 [Elgaria multicarinata webbii]|uniref:UDP-glucuronosyltransferase 3A2 n=1 Tax=Elgaria multicarinata webbii TaxID=159646 RepID=UPI002FCCD332
MIGKKLLLVLLFSQQFLHLQGFKILTLSFLGGSHFLLMNEISNILHKRGHEVRMFLQEGEMMSSGVQQKHLGSYQITTWSAGKDYIDEFQKWFDSFTKDCMEGRETVNSFLDLMGHMAYQCQVVLSKSKTLNSLKEEEFDIAVIDAFNPCSFLVAEKLGVPFIAFFPGTLFNGQEAGIPSPPSYVPVFRSFLTDRMDFWGRLKNSLMYFAWPLINHQVHSKFESAINEHFPAGSRPSISQLYLKAELWIYNMDFSIEFARPLLSSTVYVGGLLTKPAKSLPQELEDFIEKTGEAGFIVVTMGTMVSSLPLLHLLKEMNEGFRQLPQGVIWRYQTSRWPKEISLASNVKIMDWVPQNDLLGHPKARLFVTHGGLNGLMEAIYHGVPVVGIPVLGDHLDNMVRVEARKMGLFLHITQLKAEDFTHAMKEVIGDPRYKSAAKVLSTIHHSHPFTPEQRLAGWIEHILQVGSGKHLQPYAFHQPWYQRYLLDVWLFLSALLLGSIYLCVKLFLWTCGSRKLKQA